MKKETDQPPAKDTGDASSKIFPQRLMELLNEPSNHDAVIWLPHGKAFLIIDRQQFSVKVLPKYFRKTKYASFTRKLNRWNFSRVTQGPDLGAYYHEFFQRGNEALCIQMYCKNRHFKYATSRDVSSTIVQNKNYSSNYSSAISDTQQSSNNLIQSLVSKIHAQAPQIAPAQVQSSLMPSSILSNILPPKTVDPTAQIRALISKQQAQIRQEQFKLSLINTSNPFLTSQLQPQLQPMTQEQMSQKVELIEIQMEAIRMIMKQDQLQTQPQKPHLIRQTSASAA